MTRSKRFKKLLSAFLVLMMLASLCAEALAAGTSGDTADAGEMTVTVHFVTNGGIQNTIDFPYSDSYFLVSDSGYNAKIAKASTGLTAAAYRDGYDTYAEQYFTEIGFNDIDVSAYETLPGTDTIAYCIAWKQIGDFKLVAVGVCGGGYGKEWASNFKVGNEERAVGFNEAAQKVENAIYRYVDENGLEGPMKLWITGQSRAGAVSNITAADMTDSGLFTDVFGYSFGTPRVTRNKGDYDNIFCIISKDDIVPKVPLPDWGYERYGTDLYLRSQECDSDFYPFAVNAHRHQEGTGKFRNNPFLYDQYRVIFDYLLEFMPTSADYEERLQDTIISVIAASDDGDLIKILRNSVFQMTPKTPDEKDELQGFLSFLDETAAQYILEGNTDQVKWGFWRADESIGQNMMVEHTVTTYITWMLSAPDDIDFFTTEKDKFIHLVFTTDADVMIYSDIGLVETITMDGPTDEEPLPGNAVLACARNGKQVIIDLPKDQNYTICFTPEKEEMTQLIATEYSIDSVKPEVIMATAVHTEANNMTLIMSPGGDKGIIIDESGQNIITEMFSRDSDFSMSTINKIENINVFNMSVYKLIKILVIAAVLILAEILVMFILAILRKITGKEKTAKRNLIVCIVNVAFLYIAEEAVWYFAPAIPTLNVCFEVMTYITIFFYALNSRKVKKYRWIYIAMLGVMFILASVDFAFLRPISAMGMFIELVRDALLTTWAVFLNRRHFLGYQKKKAKKESASQTADAEDAETEKTEDEETPEAEEEKHVKKKAKKKSET